VLRDQAEQRQPPRLNAPPIPKNKIVVLIHRDTETSIDSVNAWLKALRKLSGCAVRRQIDARQHRQRRRAARAD
jgi:hypothetical protein